MGCARSGSTLTYQYLSASGAFTYPSNFISRFPYAPYIGAKLQHMLIHDDHRNEIIPSDEDNKFTSRLGKTLGATSPHEFWYFWRRFFPFDDTQELVPEILAKVDGDLFIRELRAFQSVMNRPLLLKGMILNWHIPFLANLYSKSYFIYLRRNLATNARSLLAARESFFGESEKWYSFKPPGYQSVLDLSPQHQVAWQVLETNAAIEGGLKSIPRDRVIEVPYEEFCKAPIEFLRNICQRTDTPLPPETDQLPAQFAPTRTPIDDPIDWDQILSDLRPFAIRHPSV